MSEAAKREEEVLKFWNEREIFKKTLQKPAPKGEYIFFDGPPFATGLPHHGSLLSSIIKDVVPRYKTMRGYRVPRRWGWDCHGLPIENLIEKRLNLKTKKDIERIGIDVFNQAARASVLEFEHEWERYVDRVGRWVDFKNSYKTMDNSYIESVWWALKQLNDKKLLYEGKKVLMYCPHCETPLAKAEIAMDHTYQDIIEEAVTVKFKIKNPSQHKLPKNSYLLTWTTTPWTLPGNVALTVGKDIRYGLIEKGAENHISAKEGGELTGEDLVGVEYEPLYNIPALRSDKLYKVYAADFVSTEEGTGVVHTAVMYGEDDFALGQKEGLPMVQLLRADGHYNDQAPEFIHGKYIKDAERDIKHDLENRGLLYEKKVHTHSYPHCYRCGTPLIYNAVVSWFINIQKVKQRMLAENKKITWVPEHLKYGRFKNIVESAPDWTISRNRFWASPLPIWKCTACSEVKVIGSVEELKTRAKEPVPENLDLHRPHVDVFTFSCTCGGRMHRIPEVVDCWVESGAMPFASVGYPKDKLLIDPGRWFGFAPKGYPADFIAEYIAQTRTWFYYMHAIGVLLFNRLAFKTVVSTGTVLAADGAKISKSKGNYTDPLVLIDQFGADAYRFYLMGSVVMQAEDVAFRDEEVREAHNRVVGILWNSCKFFELYKHEYDGTTRAAQSPRVLDRWVRTRLAAAIKEITEALDLYDMPRACRTLRVLIDDYSTWYVRRSRERVKGEDSADKQYTLATQRESLLAIAALTAPLMPFIAESIYRTIPGDTESVHLSLWPTVGVIDEKLLLDMEHVRDMASQALKQREIAGIKIRQPLPLLKIKMALGEELKKILAQELNAKKIVHDPTLREDVWLDTTLTSKLKEEGVVRDLIRRIQEWRKSEKFAVADRPSFELKVSPEEEGVAKKHRAKIIAATGLRDVTITPDA